MALIVSSSSRTKMYSNLVSYFLDYPFYNYFDLFLKTNSVLF